MELNAVSRHKFGYVQQSLLCRSRTGPDQQETGVAETMP